MTLHLRQREHPAATVFEAYRGFGPREAAGRVDAPEAGEKTISRVDPIVAEALGIVTPLRVG
jgi:hypothetical protein